MPAKLNKQIPLKLNFAMPANEGIMKYKLSDETIHRVTQNQYALNMQERAKNCITSRLRSAGLCEHTIHEAVKFANELLNNGTPLFTSIHRAIADAKSKRALHTGPFAA